MGPFFFSNSVACLEMMLIEFRNPLENLFRYLFGNAIGSRFENVSSVEDPSGATLGALSSSAAETA